MTTDAAPLFEVARDWIAGDPDPVTRDELQRLVDARELEALRQRVDGVLEFGTAGIRGLVGAGPLRMNRAVVIRTTAGLVAHLQASVADLNRRPVVVGYDARPDSERFAEDVIGVLAAADLQVRYFARPVPTPLVAYAARVLDAAAAVVVTASHNPPEYNGYKVYAANGAQIIPPDDRAIAAAIDAVGPAVKVPRAPQPRRHPATTELGDDLVERYLDEVDRLRTPPPDPGLLRAVYTPLHGVGWSVVRRALRRAGYDGVVPVPAQVEPDGAFPTVRFPNPEEPGALDLAYAAADEAGADLVLANDPDADRLAVAVRERDGWRPLTGNQVGVLLGDHALATIDVPDRPLVLSSIVSSPMVASVAAAHDAHWEPTLTGFKWICNAALDLETQRVGTFVFGYEEALGYTIGRTVRDKDGISALLFLADLATGLAADGRTLLDRLADLYRQHGLWVSVQHSVTRPGVDGQREIADAIARVATSAPTQLGGLTVTGVTDFRVGAETRPRWLPATDLVAFDLEGGSRVLIRPSGTEPKVKIYADLRAELSPADDVWAVERRLTARAGEVARDLARFAGLA